MGGWSPWVSPHFFLRSRSHRLIQIFYLLRLAQLNIQTLSGSSDVTRALPLPFLGRNYFINHSTPAILA